MSSQKTNSKIVLFSLGGALIGVIFGIILSLSIDNFAFIGVFGGAGVAIGTAIGLAWSSDERR